MVDFKVKLNSEYSELTSGYHACGDRHIKLPASLNAIKNLKETWTSLNKLLDSGLTKNQIVSLIKAGIVTFGGNGKAFPIHARAYLESQFPRYIKTQPFTRIFESIRGNYIWIGMPLNNILDIRHSTAIGLALIIDNLNLENDPFFSGILPYATQEQSCIQDVENILAIAEGCHHRVGFLGGDHRVTWVILSALKSIYQSKRVRYVHIDAHSDLYGITDVDAPKVINHANFLFDLLMRGIVDEVIVVGCRDNIKNIEEAKKRGLPIKSCSSLKELRQKKYSNKGCFHTHLSIDIDVLDPKLSPDVSNPLEYGWDLTKLLTEIDTAYKMFVVNSVSLVEICQGLVTYKMAVDLLRYLNNRPITRL
jgi:arginase family enzyme